ncbi:MAG: DUF58 domain-containing protein [Polyangiaceae bacterium]|nr:DUF58 domain-containing protein [Polyangiaceae bacterium]
MVPSRALVLLALAPLVLAFGMLFDKTLLWPMLATDAGIVLVAIFDGLLTWRPTFTVKRHAAQVFSIGRPNPITLEVRSRTFRTLTVEIKDDLFDTAESTDFPISVEVPARTQRVVKYHVTPTKRGAFVLGSLHLRYRSPLGLWIRQVHLPIHTPVRVYPDVTAVRQYELLAREDRESSMFRTSKRRGGESEFERLREYRRGDEYRSIDWKATARKQKLISREYQLESNQNILFLIDAGRLMTAETGGMSLFDHALNSTLMLAHVAAKGGDNIGLLTFADDVRTYAPPEGGSRAARRIVQAGYNLHPELVETNYEAAYQKVSTLVRKRSLVVLFTQVLDDLSAKAVIRLARGLLPRHLPLFVLFRDADVDALLDPQAATTADEGDLYTSAAAAELVSFRDRIMRELKKQGALVLDVPTSDLTPTLMNRYLEIKARHLL